MQNVMDVAEMNAFLARVFPEVKQDYRVDAIGQNSVTLRLIVQERHLRPGGTVSGPAMFGLADVAAYMATLAKIGPRALAVTTNCSIDFMRKPEGNKDLIATGRVLKLGRQLSVMDVMICSEGSDKAVARASLTYSLPPKGSGADVDF